MIKASHVKQNETRSRRTKSRAEQSVDDGAVWSQVRPRGCEVTKRFGPTQARAERMSNLKAPKRRDSYRDP